MSRAGFVRAARFLLFMLLPGVRGALGSAHVGIDVRWVYAVAVALVGALLI